MTDTEQLYFIEQRKLGSQEKDLPVYAKLMKSKDGVFEGVSFIRSKDKASLMSLAEAQQAVAWAKAKKPLAKMYETKIVPVN
jgi:hypothetical protein